MTTPLGTLGGALVEFQKAAPQIARSKTVKVQTKQGGSYTFDYAPFEAIVEAIREPLAANGLAYSQLLSSIDGKPSLRTVLLHKDGDGIESEFPLPIKEGQTAQEIGSLISYMRRYALVSVLGLATDEDDDANVADGNSVAKVDKPQAKSIRETAEEFAANAGVDFWEVYDEVYPQFTSRPGDNLTRDEAKTVCEEIAKRKKAK